RHSKNNCSLPVFTAYERSILKYGTQKQRLGKESLRNFYDCWLCLARAIEPMCCSKGHIACKECILENILAQKTEIARQAKAASQHVTTETMRQREQAEREHAKVVEEFQKSHGTAASEKKTNGEKRGELPSFWVVSSMIVARAIRWCPSLTPNATATAPEVSKTEVVCCAEESAHPVSIKKLFPVEFLSSKDEKGDITISCPSCTKTLTNGSKVSGLKSCKHTLCPTCVKTLAIPDGKCPVCSAKVKEKDVVEIRSGGTGFAARGGVQAVKVGVAFQ
ncbi:hypothetical protein M427DRAFT_97470, partial [Gonapodya prolifera JEL478]